MQLAATHCASAGGDYLHRTMEFSVSLPDEPATARLGGAIAPLLRAGDILALSGPLGAGKTTIARAIISRLTGRTEAPSPTFTLVETYETDAFTLSHFDLYRLEKAGDVWELGFEEALDGVSLIEWPERIEGLLPASTLVIRLTMDGSGRRALVRGDGEWPARLKSLNPA
jgi:tRNA threonylcarbamoyladenosine biosynthesis protein TsaE